MNNYIDTHIHLDLLNNLNDTINYIESNKIYVIAMTNHPKVYEIVSQKQFSKYIRYALGMHPELVDKANMTLFKKYINTTKYIGEVGLDFSHINNREKQINLFNEILKLSHRKIINIHSRKAEETVLRAIEENYDKTSSYILHWYTGNKKSMLKAIDLGCYFSINLDMLKTKKFIELFSYIPKNRILVETDAPFSKGNLINLTSTYALIAELVEQEEIVVKETIYCNFEEMLNKSVL